jgi:hypothetical protein
MHHLKPANFVTAWMFLKQGRARVCGRALAAEHSHLSSSASQLVMGVCPKQHNGCREG